MGYVQLFTSILAFSCLTSPVKSEENKMVKEISIEAGKTQSYLRDIRKVKAIKKMILDTEFENFKGGIYFENVLNILDLELKILSTRVGEELYKQIED